MAEEALIPEPGLLSLPVELLHEIGELLSPQDLLAASATCRYLRSVFNVDSLWRKYSERGLVSRGLDKAVSLVEPTYQNPCSTSLESLCEHRLHFLKQSRLLCNIRQSNFVKNSISFSGFLSDFETSKPLNNRQITYGGRYLFAIDYNDNNTEVIRIFDITASPKQLLTVDLDTHSHSYCVITWVQVVGDRLVVRRDEWFDIYDIRLPESLERSFSININGHGNQAINDALIIGGFLFVENITKNAISIWDLSNGELCSDLAPQIECNNFDIIGYSQIEQLLVLSIGMTRDTLADPHLFVYDVKTQDYSPFRPILDRSVFISEECYGLIDDNFVVLLNFKTILNHSAYVFDYKTSALLAMKSNLLTRKIEDAKTFNGYLVLPSLVSILVMSLKTLQTVWEIQLDTARSLVYEFPVISMVGMELLYISSLSTIIVVQTVDKVELWDLHGKRKILHMANNANVALDDTFSKVILHDFCSLTIVSFW